jgi:hypothetical protein
MTNHLFKQILIKILFLILILILTSFIVKYLFVSNHKIFVKNDIVKYPLSQTDKDYFKKYSKKGKLFDKQVLFYTKSKWSTKNNNYILFKDNYYIIEPGYYYYINDETQTFYNKNIQVYYKI